MIRTDQFRKTVGVNTDLDQPNPDYTLLGSVQYFMKILDIYALSVPPKNPWIFPTPHPSISWPYGQSHVAINCSARNKCIHSFIRIHSPGVWERRGERRAIKGTGRRNSACVHWPQICSKSPPNPTPQKKKELIIMTRGVKEQIRQQQMKDQHQQKKQNNNNGGTGRRRHGG